MEASTSNSCNNNNELFICFTSRLSSSMKLSSSSSSKSLLSPGRAQISLSTSLSRRLRTSASLKSASAALGQASPMFPSKKRSSGCASAFDNPEPSSPKVTCIGQVRVKTKSKKKRTAAAAAAAAGIARSRSSHHHRRSLPSSAEASFRKTPKKDEDISINNNNKNNQNNSNNNNNKWICETLRTFLLSPCWSSSTSNNNSNKREDEHRKAAEKAGRSCGAVFGRWLVAVQDGGDGKGRTREIELVVSSESKDSNNVEDNGGEAVERSGSLKRRVFEGIEFRELEEQVAAEAAEVEKGRVSLCVPPKNALLLMRCRSDPVKMAALASRFWESPSAAAAADQPPPAAGEEDDDDDEREVTELGNDAEESSGVCEEGNGGEVMEKIDEVFDVMEAVVLVEEEEEEEEETVDESLVSTDQEKVLEEEEEESDEEIGLKLLFDDEDDDYEEEEEEKVILMEEEDCLKSEEAENKKVKVDQLPDCLLLMMCEPKLSMEVSKETWVCTTDFVRWLPDRRRPPPNPKKPSPKPKPPLNVDDSNPAKLVLLQPPRSSCSAMTTAKLAANKPYEPLVLTRCKSEPVKSAAAAKLAAAAVAAPESCLWNNRKLEPHHHRLGVGGAAAGVGF